MTTPEVQAPEPGADTSSRAPAPASDAAVAGARDAPVETRCVLELHAWRNLQPFLSAFPHTEKFGLGIGVRRGGESHILAYLWPKQEVHSPVLCQIRVTDLGIIIPFITDLRVKHGIDSAIGVSAWVHTHPHLSVFLSGTDRDTFRNWTDVDAGLIAVVLDAFQGMEPFGAFARTFARMPAMIGALPYVSDPKWYAFFEDLDQGLYPALAAKQRPLECLVTPFTSHYSSSD